MAALVGAFGSSFLYGYNLSVVNAPTPVSVRPPEGAAPTQGDQQKQGGWGEEREIERVVAELRYPSVQTGLGLRTLMPVQVF